MPKCPICTGPTGQIPGRMFRNRPVMQCKKCLTQMTALGDQHILHRIAFSLGSANSSLSLGGMWVICRIWLSDESMVTTDSLLVTSRVRPGSPSERLTELYTALARAAEAGIVAAWKIYPSLSSEDTLGPMYSLRLTHAFDHIREIRCSSTPASQRQGLLDHGPRA